MRRVYRVQIALFRNGEHHGWHAASRISEGNGGDALENRAQWRTVREAFWRLMEGPQVTEDQLTDWLTTVRGNDPEPWQRRTQILGRKRRRRNVVGLPRVLT